MPGWADKAAAQFGTSMHFDRNLHPLRSQTTTWQPLDNPCQKSVLIVTSRFYFSESIPLKTITGVISTVFISGLWLALIPPASISLHRLGSWASIILRCLNRKTVTTSFSVWPTKSATRRTVNRSREPATRRRSYQHCWTWALAPHLSHCVWHPTTATCPRGIQTTLFTMSRNCGMQFAIGGYWNSSRG